MKTITVEAAVQTITVEAATPDSAQELCNALSGFRADVVEGDGGQQVRVELGGGNREVAGVLNAIDEYFGRTSETAPVRITFGGRRYALVPSGSSRRYLRYADLRRPRVSARG